MPSILDTAHRKRNAPLEFVGYRYITRYLGITHQKLDSSGIFDKIPFRYDKNGNKEFKLTQVQDVIKRYRLEPPSNMHPLHEFSQAEAMLELKLKPDDYRKFVREGRIRTHICEATGFKVVYRKEIERFRRRWELLTLISRMSVPIRKSLALVIMDITSETLYRCVRKNVIHPEPRKYREREKYSKASMYKYISCRGSGHRFRRRALPESVPTELATIYMGIGEDYFNNLRSNGIVKYIPHTGNKYMYSLDALDEAIDTIEGRNYYCDGFPYYTRNAIKYKFNKTDRWVDEFIVGKCRRMHSATEILPAKGTLAKGSCGWVREDVDRVVASGVECVIKKKRKVSKKLREWSSIRQLGTPPVVFSNDVDQMEAAIAAAIKSSDEARKKHQDAVLQRLRDESTRLNVIRNILTGGPADRQTRPSRNEVLRLSDEAQIVTFLFSSTGLRGRYDEYPNSRNECLFRVSCGCKFGRRVIPPVFARAIANALAIYLKQDVRVVPKWVILVSATSIITDPAFHAVLDSVPPEYGAVSAFGYDYTLPDGSWDRCTSSHGSYGLYSEINGSRRKVFGTASIDGSHPVQVMDGPFVALRGEFIRDIKYIKFFQQLGDQRGLLGPVMSAICRKLGIRMLQIPVECWGSMGYEVQPGTPEMNLAIDRITTFNNRPLAKLKDN